MMANSPFHLLSMLLKRSLELIVGLRMILRNKVILRSIQALIKLKQRLERVLEMLQDLPQALVALSNRENLSNLIFTMTMRRLQIPKELANLPHIKT